MSSVISALLNSLLQAFALVLFVWAVLRCTPRLNAATRHAVWWAVLAVVLALPAAPALLERARTRRVALPSPPAIVARVANSTPSRALANKLPAPVRRGTPVELRAGKWLGILPALWLTVMLIQLARLAGSFRYIGSLKRRAMPAPPALEHSFAEWMKSCKVDRPARLLISGEIVSPMAVGFRKPAVILPESLLANFRGDELDHVLLHELAHLARRDDWTNLAARLAAATVILHPVAAWILRRIEREREIACDDWVVSMTGNARPYAQSLTRLFELCWTRRRVLLASGMAGRSSQFGERIEELLRRREFAPKASTAKVLMSVFALLIFGLAAAGTPRWIVFARNSQGLHAEAEVPQEAKAPIGSVPREIRLKRLPPETPPQPSPKPVLLIESPEKPPAGGFLASLVAAGYGDLPVDEIIDLKNNGVTGEFIVGMSRSGWGKLQPRQLINLRNNSVTPDYADEMLDAGIRDLEVQNVIELRQHGVRPDFVREAHSLGFGPFDTREVIDLSSQGVRAELFRTLKDAGFVRLAPKEIVEAQHAGVRETHFREAKAFSSSLTLQQVIKLKNAGVLR